MRPLLGLTALAMLAALLGSPCTASPQAADAATVATFERRLLEAQTAPQQLGPARQSESSRAQALANTARVLKAHDARSRGFELGWNGLSDLSDSEYRAFLGSRPQDAKGNPIFGQGGTKQATTLTFAAVDEEEDEESASGEIPGSINWATEADGKYETPIKNQGTCGSCWAFAGVSVLESRFAIENDVQASPLSVEQVLSCSAGLDHIRSRYGNGIFSSSDGCEGGMPFLTYEYLIRLAPHGVTCGSSYPYEMTTSFADTACKSISSSAAAVYWQPNVSEYRVVKQQSESALLRAVATGPVSASLDATGDGFRHYSGGIYDANDCLSDGNEVNHAVVIVGYGETESGEQYWVLRNTWGTMWGENGYMRISRGKHSPSGPCNLYMYTSYAVHARSNVSDPRVNAGATCTASSVTLEPLSVSQLLGLSTGQLALLISVALLCIAIGIAFLYGFELMQNRKTARGEFSYKASYQRWVLPTKEQIAKVVEARRRSSEARRRRLESAGHL